MKIEIKHIEELEYSLIDSIKNSNVDFLEKVMHDDLLAVASNGEIITKEMDIASHRAGNMIVEELTANIEKVKIIGDSAIVIITYKTKGTMLGNSIEGRFKYNRVWKKFDDGMKIISASCMQL